MSRRFLKVSTILMATIILGSALSGCGADKSTGTQEEKTLRVAVFDRGNAPAGAGTVTNNYLTKYISEEFGKANGINMEFVSIPRSEEQQKLNIMMAASIAPDVCFTYNFALPYGFAKKNAILDLTQPLEKYGSELKEYLKDVLVYGQIDGKQMTIPAKRVLKAQFAQYIRKDWLDALGLPLPTNREEMYQIAKAFKEKNPGKVENVIPIGTERGLSGVVRTIILSFCNPSEKEEYTVPEFMWAGYLEGLQYVNKLYNEGLISPDYPLDKGDMVQKDVASGKVGYWMSGHGADIKPNGNLHHLMQNAPDAEVAAVDVWSRSDGTRPKTSDDPYGLFIFVPKFSKNVNEAIMYLNWLANPEVSKRILYGEEGKHYTETDSIPVSLNNEYVQKDLFAGFDLALPVNGNDFGDDMLNVIAASKSRVGFEQLFVDTYQYAMNDAKPRVRYETYLEEYNKLADVLSQKKIEIVTKCVIAQPGQVESIYKQGVEEYLAIGGQAEMDEKTAAYRK